MNPAIAQEGYIPVPGGQVWYSITGTGPEIPLLALHGGPGLGSSYLEPLTVLADERPVILYDQLGGGKSERPDDLSLWVLDRFVEELRQVRAALGLTEVHLLGQSWGTILAVEYALTRPPGLVSLVLAGPVLSVPRYAHDAHVLKQQLPAEIQAAIERHEADGTYDAEEYQAATMEWNRRYLSRNEAVLMELMRTVGDPNTGMNPQIYLTMQGPSEFAFTGNLKDWDRTQQAPQITVPTLFACGRYDECTPDATSWYHSLVPGSEMVVFEESAHLTHLEETELFIATVRSFLRRVEGSTTWC